MKFSAFFAIPLLLAFSGAPSANADDVATSSRAQGSSSQDADSGAKTTVKTAEMRAQIMMARKDYSEAAVAYQRILDKDPNNAEVLNQIGIAYQAMGQSDLATHYYRKALRADKNSSQAMNNLGTVEYGRARFGKAIKDYKKAIAMGGDGLAPIYSNLGYAYCGEKQFPLAMDAFGKALALDPTVFENKGTGGSVVQHRTAADQATLYFILAKSYAKTGDVERAARYLKLARDDGYKNFMSAEKDPDFVKVIKDPQVQDVLHNRPAYEAQQNKPVAN